LPTIAWAIFILVICTNKSNGNIGGNLLGIPTDKLGHAFVFAVLEFLLLIGLRKTSPQSFSQNKIRLYSIVTATVYGILIEFIQHYCTSNRTADFWDVIADIFGAFLGLAMFHTVYGDLKFLDRDETM
jgi:VanZ family protein